MRTLRVVAAVIRSGERIFATQRGYGEWKDYWEAPGGKIEPGESPIQALRREILEELDTEISVDKFLTTIEWDYPEFHLTMHCYMCSLLSDSLHLNEVLTGAFFLCGRRNFSNEFCPNFCSGCG